MEQDIESKDAIANLQSRVESAALNLVVIGKVGQGKSTLVNNLLGLTEGESHAARVGELATTKRVQLYSQKRYGAVVKVWDTPGLSNQTDMNEKILSEISEKTETKADVVLVCIAYAQGFRLDDSHQIVLSQLTKFYTKDFWTHAVIVMTMVNCASKMQDKVSHHDYINNVDEELRKTISASLKDAGMSMNDAQNIASKVPLLTAGYEPGNLPFEDEEWNRRLFRHCLENSDCHKVPKALEVESWTMIPPEVANTVVGTGVGVVIGAGLGAGAGAIIGLVGGPAGAATGGWVGAVIGGVFGGVGGGRHTYKCSNKKHVENV